MKKFTTFICLFATVTMLTVSAHASFKDEGRELLFNNGNYTYSGILAANGKFKSAVGEDPNDPETRFLYAVTNVFSTALMPGNGGLETLRDVLEAFGMTRNSEDSMDNRDPFSSPPETNGYYDPPLTTPGGEDIRAFLAGPFVDTLDVSIANLDEIPSDFVMIIDKDEIAENEDLEVDYGDVLLLNSMLRFMKSLALIMSAYNIDVDIRELIAIDNRGKIALQRDLFDKYADVLELIPADGAQSLQSARSALIESIGLFSNAFDVVISESDPQGDDLFSFASYEDLNEANDFKATLNEVKNSLEKNRTAKFSWSSEDWMFRDGSSGMQIWVDIDKNQDGDFSGGDYDSWNWPCDQFISCYGEILSWTVEGSKVTIILAEEDVQLEATLTGTIKGGNITNGNYTVTKHGAPAGSGTFTGTRQETESDTTEMDFNCIFGNGKKKPLNIRQTVPEFDKYNEIIPGTFPTPILNNGLSHLKTNNDITEDMELLPEGYFIIPSATITVDGNTGDWSGINPVLSDPQGDEDEDNNNRGMDIKTFRMAKDSTFYYFLVETHDDVPDLNGLNYGPNGWYPMYQFYAAQGTGQTAGDRFCWAHLHSPVLPPFGIGGPPDVGASEMYGPFINGYNDYSATGGKAVEWKIPKADMGELSGKFVEVLTLMVSQGGYSNQCDTSFSRIMIDPVSVSGTLNCSAYTGGNIYISAFDGNNPYTSKYLGNTIVDGPGPFSIEGLLGTSGYLFAFWDSDGNGITSGGDSLGGPQAFTAPAGSVEINLNAKAYYRDSDGDGYGNPYDMRIQTSQPGGYVQDHTDCDDTDGNIRPNATETPYDGIDQDCDCADMADVDGDGFNARVVGGKDCDDNDASLNPAAVDICGNGKDEDCDGNADGPGCASDADGDGVPDFMDICPDVYNPDQEDSDNDRIGDVCEIPGPTCSKDKLKAASALCKSYLSYAAKWIKNTAKTDFDLLMGKAELKFKTSWDKAELKAGKKEVECLTGTMTEIKVRIEGTLEAMKNDISGGIDPNDKNATTLGKALLGAINKYCGSLLKAEMAYIKNSDDGKLIAARSKAEAALVKSYEKATATAQKKGVGHTLPFVPDVFKTTIDDMVEDLIEMLT